MREYCDGRFWLRGLRLRGGEGYLLYQWVSDGNEMFGDVEKTK